MEYNLKKLRLNESSIQTKTLRIQSSIVLQKLCIQSWNRLPVELFDSQDHRQWDQRKTYETPRQLVWSIALSRHAGHIHRVFVQSFPNDQRNWTSRLVHNKRRYYTHVFYDLRTQNERKTRTLHVLDSTLSPREHDWHSLCLQRLVAIVTY